MNMRAIRYRILPPFDFLRSHLYHHGRFMTTDALLPGIGHGSAFIDQHILDDVLRLKYGDPPQGWGPRQRRRLNYYTPDDIYEAAVAGFVTKGCAWLDVGC